MKINYKNTNNVIMKLVIPSILMIAIISILRHFITFKYTLISSIISLMIYGLLGVFIYFIITYKSKLLEDVFKEDIIKKLLRK